MHGSVYSLNLTIVAQVPTKPSDKVEEQRVHADQKLLKRLQDVRARFNS